MGERSFLSPTNIVHLEPSGNRTNPGGSLFPGGDRAAERNGEEMSSSLRVVLALLACIAMVAAVIRIMFR
jgi:hypothetical protein